MTDLQVPANLDERFSPEQISGLCEQFLYRGTGVDLRKLAGGREFVVAYVDAADAFADIARSVEVKVFADVFKLAYEEVLQDYGKYDPASCFVTVIDVSQPVPVAAAALRMIEHTSSLGFKDVNDLLVDLPENPWLDELKDQYFDAGESYDADVAWQRLGDRNGGPLVLSESLDIASHAAMEQYRGRHGALTGASMLLFHACLRYAIVHRKRNLLAIFDIQPFENLQQFGHPFDTFTGLAPHPYGGPYETIPAFCRIDAGIERVYRNDPVIGRAFEYGLGLGDMALLPNEYDPIHYSDRAAGLSAIPQAERGDG